ncbi:MAG: hypothetical protein MUO77_06380 [Anaerolineales bacterium]|nr:hypothetical protein [Anaerolineales bacterium]
MSEIDKRRKLEEQPFTFRATKDGKVFIHWHGRQIMILKGKIAEKFMASIDQADSRQAQLWMARVTGHFKHGNEKNGN